SRAGRQPPRQEAGHAARRGTGAGSAWRLIRFGAYHSAPDRPLSPPWRTWLYNAPGGAFIPVIHRRRVHGYPSLEQRRSLMSGDAAFVGNIPQHYDQGLGPMIFVDYAADLARRAAAGQPARVLETAAGTGIVTRRLRDVLPAGTRLTATDLNPPMLEIARTKFRPGEQVEFQPADATALPFADSSFDAVVCQFGVMFYPDKEKSYREVYRVLAPGGRYLFNVWDSHSHNPFGQIAHDTVGRFFPVDPPQFQK